MSYSPLVTTRITLLVFALGLFGLGCSTDDAVPDGGSDGSADAARDLCDIDAFSGTGNPCPRTSDRVCFAQCATGGCKCTKGAAGPVWKCTSDFSCVPDSSPFDDAAADDAIAPVDAASDADAADATSDAADASKD